ncbi:hypothetical protein BGZ95_009379 [Linnemannia exigua]|uniref:Uncharacterized protein n=1 Tax=Linnemannia exigua TaxID=604196 RepID=A0AAD4DKU2_9FUNG|nr:hypothetical protein BGZ95_009379 [Linnemannia exigua]
MGSQTILESSQDTDVTMQQSNPRQDQMLSITPRFGSQPMPFAPQPPPGTISSHASCLPLPVRDSTPMPVAAMSRTSRGNVGVVASASQSVQEHNPLTQDDEMSVDNISSNNNDTSTANAAAFVSAATSTTSSEISEMLNVSDAAMQNNKKGPSSVI